MSMSPELKNRIYLLVPLVWAGLLSLLARGTFTRCAFALGDLAGLGGVCVCADGME